MRKNHPFPTQAADGTPAMVSVWEGQEPADAAYLFLQQATHLTESDARRLEHDLCGAYVRGVGTVGVHYHFNLCELKRSN